MRDQISSTNLPMTFMRGLILFLCGLGLLLPIFIGLDGIIHIDWTSLIASLVLGIIFGLPFWMALKARPRSWFLPPHSPMRGPDTPAIGQLDRGDESFRISMEVRKARKAAFFSHPVLNRLASLYARGWMLILFLTALAAVDSALYDSTIIWLDVVLGLTALFSIFSSSYFLLRPRSLNRLMFVSDSIVLALIPALGGLCASSMLIDPLVRTQVMRIGVIYVAVVPFAVGILYGAGYGWWRWHGLGKIQLPSQLSEHAVYDLFFKNDQTERPLSYWRGVMWLILLPLMALKPVFGGAGLLVLCITAFFWMIPALSISVGIRRYFFLRQGGRNQITISEGLS